MKSSFCKAIPYILACVGLYTASASISSVWRANTRISIFCHVVIMCLLSSESVKVNPPGNEATPAWAIEKQRLETGSVCAKESHYFHVPCHMRVGPGFLAGAGRKLHYVTLNTSLPQVAALHKVFVTFYTMHAQCMLHPHISCEGASKHVKVLRLMSCTDRDDSELSVIFFTNRTRDD